MSKFGPSIFRSIYVVSVPSVIPGRDFLIVLLSGLMDFLIWGAQGNRFLIFLLVPESQFLNRKFLNPLLDCIVASSISLSASMEPVPW